MAGQMPMQRGLGVELREEDRVASRQAHHRVTPFAELRQVRRRRALRAKDHVGDEAGERAGRVVTLRALVRGDKLLGDRRRTSRPGLRDRMPARPCKGRDVARQRPEIGKDRIRYAVDEHRSLLGFQRLRRLPRRNIVHVVDHRRRIRERAGGADARRIQVGGTRVGPRICDRRRMAIQTVQSRAIELDLRLGTSTARRRRRSRVWISGRGIHQVGPIPSVPRQVRVFDHHGPFEQRSGRARETAPSRRSRRRAPARCGFSP